MLRVAGGFIVAVAGWRLLSEGSHKELAASAVGVSRTDPLDQAFYPLTFPISCGPGSIAAAITVGVSLLAAELAFGRDDVPRHDAADG